MLFKLEMCQAILNGIKTQTRRLVREGEFAVHKRIHTVYDRNGRIKWQVSRTYAIQPGRGKKAVGRLLLTGIRRERLWGISELDAIAEGCIPDSPNGWFPATARDKFEVLWDSIHAKLGTRWADNPSVWVLSFTLCEKPENE